MAEWKSKQWTQVRSLIVRGFTVKEIANRLKVSESTLRERVQDSYGVPFRTLVEKVEEANALDKNLNQSLINFDELDNYIKLGSTLKQSAYLLGVCEETLKNSIKNQFGCTWEEYKTSVEVDLKLTIRQMLLAKCAEGDTRAIIHADETIVKSTKGSHDERIALEERRLAIQEKQSANISQFIADKFIDDMLADIALEDFEDE